MTLVKLLDDMLSHIRRKNSINSQSAFCLQSAFFTRSAVYSLHFVLTEQISLFLFERASSPDRNIGALKKFDYALSLFRVVTECVEMNPLRVPLDVDISASRFKLHF